MRTSPLFAAIAVGLCLSTASSALAEAPTTPGALLGGALRAAGGLSVAGPVEVRLYAEDRCVATASTDAAGRFVLFADPGEYWLVATAGGEEIAARRVRIARGSSAVDLDAETQLIRMPPLLIEVRDDRSRKS